MENKSLKSGFCPVCGGSNVYTNKELSNQGYRAAIPVSAFRQMNVDVYLCLSCGYVQEFITNKHLKNERTAAKLKEKWKRVV